MDWVWLVVCIPPLLLAPEQQGCPRLDPAVLVSSSVYHHQSSHWAVWTKAPSSWRPGAHCSQCCPRGHDRIIMPRRQVAVECQTFLGTPVSDSLYATGWVWEARDSQEGAGAWAGVSAESGKDPAVWGGDWSTRLRHLCRIEDFSEDTVRIRYLWCACKVLGIVFARLFVQIYTTVLSRCYPATCRCLVDTYVTCADLFVGSPSNKHPTHRRWTSRQLLCSAKILTTLEWKQHKHLHTASTSPSCLQLHHSSLSRCIQKWSAPSLHLHCSLEHHRRPQSQPHSDRILSSTTSNLPATSNPSVSDHYDVTRTASPHCTHGSKQRK